MALSPEQLEMGQHDEVVKEMGKPGGWVTQNLDYLKPIGGAWRPSEVLPNLRGKDKQEQMDKMQEQSAGLPDSVLVVLVGNTVTEEAIPSYMAWLNRVQAIADQTGADEEPWPTWVRGWTAEESRHDHVLDRYLWATGRVDMEAVEDTVHSLISRGFNSQVGRDPYRAFTYTSFQEMATRVSHMNEARLARKYGDETLYKICAKIAGDESRHWDFYRHAMKEIIAQDPDGGVIAFDSMMRDKVVMPASLMDDGESLQPGEVRVPLFERFSAVAQATGVYTAADYFEIFGKFMEFWDIANLSMRTDEGKKAQNHLGLMTLPKYSSRVIRAMEKASEDKPDPHFKWIDGRQIPLSQMRESELLPEESAPAAG